MDGPSRSLRALLLEGEVQRLIAEESYSLAVILSQTMLELRVEREAKELAEGFDASSFGTAALGLLTSFNLLHGRTRKFFETALEVRFSEEMPEQVKALQEHAKLRNRVVHEGEDVGRDEARASLAAVLEITHLLHQLTYRRLGLDAILEEEERLEREDEGLEPEDDL
jgi:hypothetical protein